MGEVYLKLKFIDSQGINVIINGFTEAVEKSQLQLMINKNIISPEDYTLTRIADDEYRIKFLYYDFVKYKVWIDISLLSKLDNNILCTLRVNAGAYVFENENVDSNYSIPNVVSGKYILSLDKVNEEDFSEVSTPITICNGINKEMSKISVEKNKIQLGEELKVSSILYDLEGKKVPDGTYVVYLSMKQV